MVSLPIFLQILQQCRYREMGAQVEARLRSFTSRRELVEKTSYDDVSCSFACLANRVQQSLIELRGLVHFVSNCCEARRCSGGFSCCNGDGRPGM